MPTFNSKILAVLYALLATVAARATESIDISGRAAYVHAQTGFVFPAKLGDFHRTSERPFGSNDANIGVGYDSSTPGAEMAVTIFVYPDSSIAPTGPACDREFEGRQTNLQQAHPDARLIERVVVESPSTVHAQSGLRALYEFHGNFRGVPQLLRSESRLYCGVDGVGLIAYRVTGPASANYGPKFNEFVKALAWPRPGSARAASPAASHRPAPIMVHTTGNAAPLILVGMFASGTVGELEALDKATRERGMKTDRVENGPPPKSGVSFLGTDVPHAKMLDLYRQAQTGSFGQLDIKAIVLSPTDIGPGARPADKMRVVSASDIELP